MGKKRKPHSQQPKLDKKLRQEQQQPPPVEEEEAAEALQEEHVVEEQEPLSQEEKPNHETDNAAAEAEPELEPASEEEHEENEEDGNFVEKLLEPFSKEQLVELLRDAAATHPDVLEHIHQVADVDPVHRKIFVHGLGWDTNAETLSNAFKVYGEIEDCNAVSDKVSGKSKGYGFILFKHRSGARKALKEPQKLIGNRMTACQLASAGPVPAVGPPVSEYTQRKIYVSNVSADVNPQKLMQFFARYGEIEEGPLGLDKLTGKPKGFTLFVYKTVESAKRALEEPHKTFEGRILHCQKAIDGPKPNKPQFHPSAQHHNSHGSHFARHDNGGFVGGVGTHASPGNLMSASPGGLPFNQGASPAAAAVNPLAMAALLASQGTGFGLTNLWGSLAGTPGISPQVNHNLPAAGMVNSAGAGMQGAYGNQTNSFSPNIMGGYGQQAMQGAYSTPQIGQPNIGRTHSGVGHMGGVPPYMGH